MVASIPIVVIMTAIKWSDRIHVPKIIFWFAASFSILAAGGIYFWRGQLSASLRVVFFLEIFYCVLLQVWLEPGQCSC